MNVVIVNAYGRSNRGDSVLLDECISEVKEAMPLASISAALFEGVDAAKAVHPEVRWSERIGNTAQTGVLKSAATLTYLIIAWASLALRMRCVSRLLPAPQQMTVEAIRNAHYVISAPGGYIHDTNFSYYVALFHIYLGTLVGARVILAPQSVGPIKSRLAKFLARQVLSRVVTNCARESFSYDFLTRELGLPTSIVEKAGDSAFWNDSVLDKEDLIEWHWAQSDLPPLDGRRRLGITVVDWTFPHSESPINQKSIYVNSIATVIDHMVEHHDVIPIIFNQVSDDLEIACEIAGAARSRVFIDHINHEPHILRAFIARSTIFMGTRFHSCIFSMMAGRPTVAIAYLPKTSYILQDLGMKSRQVPIENIDANALITLLEADLVDTQAAEDEIKDAVARYRRSRARLGDILRSDRDALE